MAILLWLLAWVGGIAHAQVGNFVSPGPLAEPHGHLSGITQCTECHAPGEGVTAERCMACHDRVEKEVTTNTGFHAGKGAECISCHPDHRGADFELIQVDEQSFDHGKETGFPLDGGHRWLDCTDCHEDGDYGGLESRCLSCHLGPHEEAAGARDLLSQCTECHTTERWSPAYTEVLDHTDEGQVDFVLRGAHTDVECLDCHVDAVMVPTQSEACTSCHDDPHRAPFSNTCTECHSESSWRVRPFDHSQTGYDLEGLHNDVACSGCHKGSTTRRVAHETCEDCHEDVHEGQFAPQPCNACHSVELAGFALADFDHDATEFPLLGKHIDVTCVDCHGEGPTATFSGLPFEDCDSCHDDAHEGQFEPTPCSTCHDENGFDTVADFDHDKTDFPLLGEHLELECEACHPDNQWSGLAHESCANCHLETPHGLSVTPESCAGCHTEGGWLEIYFEHERETGFSLEPQHLEPSCSDCHQTVELFAGLDPTCDGCHLQSRPFGHYDGSCEGCHAGAGWFPADLGDNDHAITGFDLVGAHSLLECTECHGAEGTAFGHANGECISCHGDDDIHRGLLGTSCGDCHTEIAWFRTRFRHHATGWPLRGAHRLAACVDCHAVSYAGTPSDCRACHEAEADLDIIAHQGAFFADCESCHRPYTWATVSTRGTR